MSADRDGHGEWVEHDKYVADVNVTALYAHKHTHAHTRDQSKYE